MEQKERRFSAELPTLSEIQARLHDSSFSSSSHCPRSFLSKRDCLSLYIYVGLALRSALMPVSMPMIYSFIRTHLPAVTQRFKQFESLVRNDLNQRTDIFEKIVNPPDSKNTGYTLKKEAFKSSLWSTENLERDD